MVEEGANHASHNEGGVFSLRSKITKIDQTSTFPLPTMEIEIGNFQINAKMTNKYLKSKNILDFLSNFSLTIHLGYILLDSWYQIASHCFIIHIYTLQVMAAMFEGTNFFNIIWIVACSHKKIMASHSKINLYITLTPYVKRLQCFGILLQCFSFYPASMLLSNLQAGIMNFNSISFYYQSIS